jgi:hypothetical protein
LTIVALALRQAEFIERDVGQEHLELLAQDRMNG